MAHVMLQVVPKDRLEFVNLWYYPDLGYQQKQLSAWERFFGVQIHRHPAEEVGAIAGGKQELRFGDVREWIRDKYGAEWVAYGYRMDESLARRALLKPHTRFGGGMDQRRTGEAVFAALGVIRPCQEGGCKRLSDGDDFHDLFPNFENN